MSQNDFHERLKKIESKNRPASSGPSNTKIKQAKPKKSKKKFPIGMAIASVLFLGTLGGAAALVATKPELVLQVANMAPTAPTEAVIPIVNGVPYAQIKPETPLMQRLPKKSNIVMALFDRPESLEINQRYPAPNGWIRVSRDDVERVTPAQRHFLKMEQQNTPDTVTKLLNLTQFVATTTSGPKGGLITGSLSSATSSARDAIYFGPQGGIMVLDMVSFPGGLRSMNGTATSEEIDTLDDRYERLKDGFRKNFIDFDIDGIRVAIDVPPTVQPGTPIEQLGGSGQAIKWKAFLLPNYGRQLEIEGRATVAEFKALVRSIGEPF